MISGKKRKPKKQYQIRLREEQIKALRLLSDFCEVPIAEIVRDAIDDKIEFEINSRAF